MARTAQTTTIVITIISAMSFLVTAAHAEPPAFGKDYQVEIRFPVVEFTDKMARPDSPGHKRNAARLKVQSGVLNHADKVNALRGSVQRGRR